MNDVTTVDLVVNDPAALAWFARLARTVQARKVEREALTRADVELAA